MLQSTAATLQPTCQMSQGIFLPSPRIESTNLEEKGPASSAAGKEKTAQSRRTKSARQKTAASFALATNFPKAKAEEEDFKTAPRRRAPFKRKRRLEGSLLYDKRSYYV